MSIRKLAACALLAMAGCNTPPLAEEVVEIMRKGAARADVERLLHAPVREEPHGTGALASYKYRYEIFGTMEWWERVGREMGSGAGSVNGPIEAALAAIFVFPTVMVVEAFKDDVRRIKTVYDEFEVAYDKHDRVRWWAHVEAHNVDDLVHEVPRAVNVVARPTRC